MLFIFPLPFSTPLAKMCFMPFRLQLTRLIEKVPILLAFWLPALSTGAQTNPLDVTVAESNTSIQVVPAHPDFGVGSWIWAAQTFDQQTCRFWRAFEVPRSAVVKYARLRVTADNSFILWIDGREIGRGGEWRTLSEYNVLSIIGPGIHVIAVEAFNDYSAAGLVAGLQVELADGQTIDVRTDPSWRLVPSAERGWEKRKHPGEAWPAATVLASFGQQPWKQNSGEVRVRTPPAPLPALQFWQTGWFQVAWLSVCAIIVAICLRLMGKLAVQSKAQEILATERARIARDIHDEVGAGLTQLVLLGEVNQSELPTESPGRRKFDEVSEKARGLLRAMNEVVWVVNSQRDTLRDFASYVSKYAQTFLQTTAIRCRLDIGEEISALPFELAVRRNLFLALKEALNNAVKHSEATELFLRVHYRAQNVVVTIEDNGKGFDPLTADSQRNGLLNMRQRIESVGGVCTIASRPGAGCRIEFSAPLAQRPPSLIRSAWETLRLWQKRKPRNTAPQKPDAASPASSASATPSLPSPAKAPV
jgi:signal transduction histidine kinase